MVPQRRRKTKVTELRWKNSHSQTGTNFSQEARIYKSAHKASCQAFIIAMVGKYSRRPIAKNQNFFLRRMSRSFIFLPVAPGAENPHIQRPSENNTIRQKVFSASVDYPQEKRQKLPIRGKSSGAVLRCAGVGSVQSPPLEELPRNKWEGTQR